MVSQELIRHLHQPSSSTVKAQVLEIPLLDVLQVRASQSLRGRILLQERPQQMLRLDRFGFVQKDACHQNPELAPISIVRARNRGPLAWSGAYRSSIKGSSLMLYRTISSVRALRYTTPFATKRSCRPCGEAQQDVDARRVWRVATPPLKLGSDSS